MPSGERERDQGLVVCQVRVVQDDDRRLVQAQVVEQFGHQQVGRLDARAPVPVTALAEDGCVKHPEQAGQIGPAMLVEVFAVCRREQVAQARMGDAVIVFLRLTAQYVAVVGPRALEQLMQETRLPDAGFAGDEAGTARAAQRGLEVVDEFGERELPPDRPTSSAGPRSLGAVFLLPADEEDAGRPGRIGSIVPDGLSAGLAPDRVDVTRPS